MLSHNLVKLSQEFLITWLSWAAWFTSGSRASLRSSRAWATGVTVFAGSALNKNKRQILNIFSCRISAQSNQGLTRAARTAGLTTGSLGSSRAWASRISGSAGLALRSSWAWAAWETVFARGALNKTKTEIVNVF